MIPFDPAENIVVSYSPDLVIEEVDFCGGYTYTDVSLIKQTGSAFDANAQVNADNLLECCDTSNDLDYGLFDLTFGT